MAQQGLDPGAGMAQAPQEVAGVPVGLRMGLVTQNFAGVTAARADPRHELCW